MLADVEGALRNIVVNEKISFQDGLKLLGNLMRRNQMAFEKGSSNFVSQWFTLNDND